MRYTVTAERGTGEVWVFQCVEYPGAISQARSLSAAPGLMREAIAFVAEVDPDEVDVLEISPQRVSQLVKRQGWLD